MAKSEQSSGKKPVGRPRHGKTKKKSYNVYLEPEIRDEIIKADGSLTKSLENRYAELKSKKKKV